MLLFWLCISIAPNVTLWVNEQYNWYHNVKKEVWSTLVYAPIVSPDDKQTKEIRLQNNSYWLNMKPAAGILLCDE